MAANEPEPIAETGRYDMELQDYRNFILHGFFDIRRKNTVRWAIGLPLGLAAFFLAAGLLQGVAFADLQFQKIGVYLLIALVLEAAFILFMIRSQAKKVYAVQSKHGKRGFAVHEDGLDVLESGANTDYRWGELKEAYEARDLIVILHASGDEGPFGFFVPIRVFSTPEAKNRFLSEIQSRI